MTPKSEVLDYQIASSDFLRQLGEKQAASLEKRANPYIDKAKSFFGGLGQKAQGAAGGGAGGVKGWWNGMQPNTRNAIRNAGIGAGLAGLGGAALNYLNTDEDDERRNPLGAAVTGALGGAALGGLGTAGWNALKNSGKLSGESDELLAQQALAEKAEKPGWKHLADGASTAVKSNPGGTGLPSIADQWRQDFKDRFHVRPETLTNIGSVALPTASVLNDLNINRAIREGRAGGFWSKARGLPGSRNFDMAKGMERLAGNKAITDAMPKGLKQHLMDPGFQKKLQQAYSRKTSLPFGNAGAKLNPNRVKQLYDISRQQAELANPRKLRSLKGMVGRGGALGLGTFFLPEIVDAVGGAEFDRLDSEHAARLLEARQRYQK